MTPDRSGKVYLVGAGPGDPELLTLKGLRALQEADLVVYDRLANPALLQHLRPGAESVYAGKAAMDHAMSQEEINTLLVDAACLGKTVCRLKGGDPFLFGRGGEEADALAAAGVEWEYVPGVTSAIGAPGYAGIPVTHRGLGSTLAIVTAHEDPTKDETSVDWSHLAQAADTLVILMGADRMPEVLEQLIAHGRPAATPAAVVSWGTYPVQRTITGTLTDLAERCRAAGCGAPAITIVGEVVSLRGRLRWFDSRPLFGKRVVVTRPQDQAMDLIRLLESRGAEAIPCPAIRTDRVTNPDLSGLGRPYDWVVFTSVNGVYSLAASLREAGRDIRALGSARVAAIGPETARAAGGAGLRVDFVPSRYVAEQVAAEFPEPVAGKRILIPRARQAREVLPDLWRSEGAEVDVLAVYDTHPDGSAAAMIRDRIAAGTVDVVTFTSSSTVRSFLDLTGGASLDGVHLACIGPITAQTARDAGLNVDIVAETHTIPGLVCALEEHFGAVAERNAP
jgi:uroporphyrinogen III methyltransferase / synthase